MLNVLEISIEQVLNKVLLDIFDHWEWHKIISFNIMCLQLLEMALQIIVEYLLSHFAFQSCPLIEIIIHFLLERHEILI
jgi:hypothetical protein